MLYPLIFKPIVKKMIWGSESWIVSCRPQEMSVIDNGSCVGETFESYILRDKAAVLGSSFADCARFPLLIKIIRADDALSVQVHPDDAYAAQFGGEFDSGKNEMWYVLTPPHDGNLIIGLKPGTTREAMEKALKNETAENCLNRLPVKSGDMINIPAGLVHALTPGAVIAEVQQNSDITYRLYDYGRVGPDGKPRPLHISDALNVINFEGGDYPVSRSAVVSNYFNVTKHELTHTVHEKSDPSAFHILTCVEGNMTISAAAETVALSIGDTAFIPAALGGYTMTPLDDFAIFTKTLALM